MGGYPKPPDDRRCTAPKTDGTRCTQWTLDGTVLCVIHGGGAVQRLPPDDRRCTGICTGGTTRPEREGERCIRWTSPGLNVCHSHGASKKARAAGKQRVAAIAAEGKARKLVETYGRKIDTTAVEALLDEVQWTAGHVAWLRERVSEIEQGELVWGMTRVKDGGDDRGTTEEAVPNVWLKLYQAERAHLVKVCGEAIRAGVEERRVRLAEQQGQLLAKAIGLVLDALELSSEQRAKIPQIVPPILRSVSA
jgi:hypothetical protein